MNHRGWARVVAIFTIALLSGCASITGSKTQPLSITAVCEGKMVQTASCTLANDKGVSYVTTPGSAMIQKSSADLSVSCTKDGRNSMPTIVSSSSNSGIWGNILLGGPIGAAVDASTGAGFDYPPTINVMFQPPCDAIATGAQIPLQVKQSEKFPQAQAAEKLRELAKLFQEGVITKSEFDSKKALLLEGM